MKTLARHNAKNVDEFRRPPEIVMRLARMGSFHQTRLSFMRTLLRRLKKENWCFERAVWEIDDQGFGRAVYSVYGPERNYSLVAFSHDLPDHMRSDRVIATAWDATFALFDGIPTTADLDRLEDNVPKQEAGRISDSELSLSRANRSVRLWQHVIENLAEGKQPDREQLESVGYLIRTTAVYGSGKFGAADRLTISQRPELSGPFQAEMLSVWLTRAFSVDLIEHIAKARGGDKAVVIEPGLRRRLGVGNSTGLGMAPFLMNHPALLNNWMASREEAIARVRSLQTANQAALDEFRRCFEAAIFNVLQWYSEHPVQIEKLENLNTDFGSISAYLDKENLTDDFPWNRLYLWSENNLSLEGQELLVSLLLEPYGELVDDLSACMDADEHLSFFIDGSMAIKQVKSIIESQCAWATSVDYEQKENRARFWYTSAEKLEPRVGERFDEPGAEYEVPLGVGYYIDQMVEALKSWDDNQIIADFLVVHPEHRHTLRRVQNLIEYPYSEIQDNLISAEMLPIDLLRCKLSFFGATKFDPRSDRWVRICMYQDAPFPHELLAAAS
ncbi:MAG: hypothetical protein OEY09_05200 [Gammaproteobacteria bacterium]|nr:hypothetical protein [Gammaproteobacteria bacterium]